MVKKVRLHKVFIKNETKNGQMGKNRKSFEFHRSETVGVQGVKMGGLEKIIPLKRDWYISSKP